MSQTKAANHQAGVERLALVRALSHEVSSAISAIERNDLAGLTTHIAAQEEICHKLNQKGTRDLQLACESYRASANSLEEVTLWQKIREAHLGLAHLNRIYAGLVQRSQKSIGLIAALYRNHGQRYTKDEKTPPPSNHTWSCEA